MHYQIKVWGAFDLLTQSGVSIRPSARKSCALLALLALSDGHRMSRTWLQAHLWSESGAARAAGSLRQELSRLKALLGDAVGSDRLDIWLESSRFRFDHLRPGVLATNTELLQGLDIADEAFDDWLRTQRQFFGDRTASGSRDMRPVPEGARRRQGAARCTVVVDVDVEAEGSPNAKAAALFFSELLHNKLETFDVFTCVGGSAEDHAASPGRGPTGAVVVRVVAVASRGEVCLGIEIDSRPFGPRIGHRSVVLPMAMSRLRESPEIGRLVQSTTETLLDRVRNEDLPLGGTAEAVILAHEARRLTFRLDRARLMRADRLLARAYDLDPRGQYVGWRAFLRNTAFFQHRTADIFDDGFTSEELSIEALRQAPEDALVQAFSSQLEYVNQGRLAEPMIKAARAVEIDPTDPLARALLSNALTVNGRLSEGYEVSLQSVGLAKEGRYEFYFHHFACMAATASGEYELALWHARTSVSHMPDFVSPRRYEVALAMHLGDGAGVDRACDAMRRTEPDFDVPLMLDPTYPVNTLRRLPIIDSLN